MNIKKLSLKNFRNHSNISFDFKGGLNIITGNNGVGKTNIVEAIHYLSLARSFRSQDEQDLILEGKRNAEIFALIKEGDISRKIRILINKEGRQIFINDKRVSKISELSSSVNVLLFEPKDALFYKDSPKVRRNFLDINISKKSPKYLEVYSRYEKALKERNELLKQEQIDLDLLDSITEILVDLSLEIIKARQAYVKDINDILIILSRALTGVRDDIRLIYEPFIAPSDNFKEKAKTAFKNALESDLKRKATSIGVHREDFSITLNGRDIATYGSQGENRLLALALKLSPYFLIENKEKRPIIVLDDVTSELDQTHRLRLIKLLSKFEQVFITATKLEVKDAAQYHLQK